MKNVQSIRGMHDYLPIDTSILQIIEKILQKILNSYGYEEIRTPVVEYTSLFQRAIGDVTDVIEKEMYNFNDRNGENLTLRPEGTAGCVRAYIENKLFYKKSHKLWYLGPMFRYERPQKGRYRQFYQLGVETFGLSGPNIDAELIIMSARWWKELGIIDDVLLELNSLGSISSLISYRNALMKFLVDNKNMLDEDSKIRMYTNPLRVLDSKNPLVQNLLKKAPILIEYLDKNALKHFNELCAILKSVGINYKINHHLVRGLDYYNLTVFEWTTNKLGSQKTICAGGRYDQLVESLGGPVTPAIGLAIGMERLLLLIQNYKNFKKIHNINVYVMNYGLNVQLNTMKLVEKLRSLLPKITFITHFSNGNFRKQLNQAYKYNSRLVLILGEDEIKKELVTIKDLNTNIQNTYLQSEIADVLAHYYYP